MIREIAPAKINLYLHVGPLRRDRLHALTSLFLFADIGDVVTVEPARDLTLAIGGEFGASLALEPAEKNLVMRAARALQKAAGVSAGARITLDKKLPIASGVGGGSADAAAALRALRRAWKVEMGAAAFHALAFRLGADVPACLDRAPALVSGAGETIAPAPSLPPLWVALVNPRVPMPTGPIFRAFDAATPAPLPPQQAHSGPAFGYRDVARLFSRSRNDLEAPAIAREPVIADVIARLGAFPGAIGARMSGSGASAFGLFSSAAAAARAATALAAKGWWSKAGQVYSGPQRETV